jgi:phage tail protein X
VSLVNRILKAKGRNAAADTSGLEQQIDSIVYEVYGLTSTDVQVVEGNTGLQSAIPDVTEDDGS